MTCKRIAKLLSEQLDRELPLSRRIAIRIHLSWCVFCRRLARHLVLIHGVCEKAGEAGDSILADAALSPESKERMKKMLAR